MPPKSQWVKKAGYYYAEKGEGNDNALPYGAWTKWVVKDKTVLVLWAPPWIHSKCAFRNVEVSMFLDSVEEIAEH